MIPQTEPSDTDDRILGSTRVVAALIIPFLVVAFVILYLLPNMTDQLFAWTIMPRMSALLMGAGYASGVYSSAASCARHAGIGSAARSCR